MAVNPAFNPLCPKCGMDVETLTHALRDYVKTRDVLIHGGVDGRILRSEWNTVREYDEIPGEACL